MRLQGKVAVTTGVCGGIGQSIIRKLVDEGARVIAFLTSEEARCINGCTVYASDEFEKFKYPLLPG